MSNFNNLRDSTTIGFIVTLLIQTRGYISLTKWVIILSITLACTGISFTINSLLGLYDEK